MSELGDVAAERGVLAGIFQYGNETYTEIADIVTPNSFTFESNQIIFKCLVHLLENKGLQNIDVASVWSAANDLGYSVLLNKPDERNYLRALNNFPIKKENVRKLAGKIRKLEIARQLQTQLDVAKAELKNITGDEPIDHILGLAENPVAEFTSKLSNGQGEGPQLIGNGIDEYIKYVSGNQRDMVGISTGYKYYDMAIGGGLRRKTVNLIGARPKIGKTMLADNIALHIAGKTGIPVLNLDTEMSQEDHWNRMIANLAEVKIQDIETGKFANNSFQAKKVQDAVNKLRRMPYFYKSIAGLPFEETVAHMRRWVTKEVGLEASGKAKPCVIIYDYLKLMDSAGLGKNLQEYQLLGFQMTGLHNFMVRYDVACLAFIQLNRDGITREDTDVASGSDRLIWLCSNFSLYKKKGEEEIKEDNGKNVRYNRKLVPLIARHGGGLDDDDYINMTMQGEFARITEGKTRKEAYTEKAKGELIDDPTKLSDEDRQL